MLPRQWSPILPLSMLVLLLAPFLASATDTPRTERSASSYGNLGADGTNKYRNDLSSMFSFQYTPPEPIAGPRHIRQNPPKPDGFGSAPSVAGGGGSVYWVAADPNSPDLQMWPSGGGGGGAMAAGGGPAANGGGGVGGPSLNAYGNAALTRQQVAAQQQQPQASQMMMTSSSPMFGGQQQQQAQQAPQQQQVQSLQQQQPQMMPMQQFQGNYGYGQQQQSAGGYGSGNQQVPMSPYAAYLEKQINSYPIMIYTLADCIPCQRSKHLLAVHYPDVRAHYLELSGNEPWQQQLQIDLQYLTGAITFPYIFVCGQYIGGSSELFELHESGQLRRMVSQCLKTAPKN